MGATKIGGCDMKGFEDWTINDVLKHNARIKNTPSKIDLDNHGDKLLDEKKKSKYIMIDLH